MPQLPAGNGIPDGSLAELADDENRVVVTKDREVRNSHLLRRRLNDSSPSKAGNVANAELLALFAEHLDTVVEALSEAGYVELGSTSLIVHGDRARTQVTSLRTTPLRRSHNRRLPPAASWVQSGRGKPLRRTRFFWRVARRANLEVGETAGSCCEPSRRLDTGERRWFWRDTGCESPVEARMQSWSFQPQDQWL